MKIKELRERTIEELLELLAVKRQRIRELRFNLTSGKVKNIRELRGTKKEIAMILTILNEKRK